MPGRKNKLQKNIYYDMKNSIFAPAFEALAFRYQSGQAILLMPLQVHNKLPNYGALAHLARASDWQSGGDRFKSDMLHHNSQKPLQFLL